ncbi:MAG: Chemotaxis protein cheY [Candidatus Magnetoglobus multicellularis str. Araruama]|uniref:Chemotaxis protein cheY n=1 Tax=Candidatus Magnetoglobus multicellularis str. Araruama TaxID=890399 RepID=A0A1V1NWD6_9BACT|nr:MAG: Chemotaxis protein cheY [Candidatus Magnetoglobus multicellularis str. Araruama]
MELMDINGRALFLSMKKRRPDMQCILISDHNCNSNVQECDQLQVFKRSVDMKSLSELVNQMVSKMEKNQLLHKNILVVEDTRVLLLTQVKMLKKLGFTNIDIAHNGKQAIELLNEKDDYPGLIISDWYMPEKNGLELLQWVRTNERFKHTPFIMATSKKEAMMAIEAGANHFLIKPFDMETIQTAIEKVLGASN